LIGMAAMTAGGDAMGRVRGVYDFGAGDMLEIEGDGGDTVLVPFTRDAVPEIDMDGGSLTVVMPEASEPADEAGETA
ncbi:MAG: PRC-barrel domain-containing protein, partial [Rhodospirillales bacterium]|nr:PRC-barrel domain-containing protein [Rhodospirillales bacterium]